MIICVSGLTGSGKSTVGREVSRMLKIRHIGNSYKDTVISSRNLISFLSTKADKKFARNFDKLVVKEAGKGDCVVTTWLGPWMVKRPTLSVWLYAGEEERARRKAKGLKMSQAEALAYVRKKDRLTIRHFKKVYGIDVNNHSNIDFEINTGKLGVKETVGIIAYLSLEKERKRFG